MLKTKLHSISLTQSSGHWYRHLSSSAVVFDHKPKTLSHAQAQRVIFGQNKLREQLGIVARQAGIKKALIVQDHDEESDERARFVHFLMMQANIPCFSCTLKQDVAAIDSINAGYEMAKRMGVNGVIGFGGGNALDASRAIAAMVTNGAIAETFLQDAAGQKPLPEQAAPHIIVPTISGSGGEVSTEALVLNDDAEAKVSFTSTPLIPEAVIIDPILMSTVPQTPTAEGALTAAGQCIESLSKNDNVDKLCMEALQLVATSLAEALKTKKILLKDMRIRENFALASLYSSIASVSTGFGAAHSLGISLGGVSTAPHAEICASFLPEVLEKYQDVIEENEDDESFFLLGQLAEAMLEVLNTNSGLECQSLAEWFRVAKVAFKIPNPAELGFDDSMVKFVSDTATARMEDVAKSESILDRTDLKSIVQSVLQEREN